MRGAKPAVLRKLHGKKTAQPIGWAVHYGERGY